VYLTMGSREESKELPMELKTFEVPCLNCGESSFNILLKPRITHRLICPRCKTSFYVHVKKDLGIIVLRGDEYKKARCPECRGTGVCKKCNGTGCDNCRGSGVCPMCGGEGLILGEE